MIIIDRNLYYSINL